ncbi:MAG: hypothetical protein ACFBZ8_07660 [Opitutales bacterium]
MLSTDVSTPEIALRHHLALCDEVYRILQAENTMLRREGRLPDTEILQRKEKLLGVLEDSLRQLRSLNALGKKAGSADERELLRLVQRKLMKILHLDRENERLLLPCTMPQHSRRAAQPFTTNCIQTAYATG